MKHNMSDQTEKCPTCSGRMNTRVLPDAQETRVECPDCRTHWYEELWVNPLAIGVRVNGVSTSGIDTISTDKQSSKKLMIRCCVQAAVWTIN